MTGRMRRSHETPARARRLWSLAVVATAGLALLAVGGVACGDDSSPGDAGDKASAETTAGPLDVVQGVSSQGSLSITSLTSPAPLNTMASLAARTRPGTACTLAYITPGATESNAAGLGAATADASGAVSWQWRIGGKTQRGSGLVRVTCGSDTLTARLIVP